MKDELTIKLDKYIEESAFYYDLPGLAIGAGSRARDYKYKGAAGYRNIDTKETLKPDDIFHMASVTKLFTGMAIMMLIEEKKLKFEDKMVEILPNAPIDDKRYEKVTIEHILTHTSGIVDSQFLWAPEDRYFSYQDMTYDALGLVVKEASGMYYDEYVKEKILLPLGMTSSEISVTQRAGLVSAHAKNEEKEIIAIPYFNYRRERAPSSTLTSNLEDMKKWAEEFLYKKTLLKPEIYDFILREHVPIPAIKQHMCISWFKREQAGYSLYGHIGSDVGYRSGFWICPELGLHLTVLANITNTPIIKICEKVFEMLIHATA